MSPSACLALLSLPGRRRSRPRVPPSARLPARRRTLWLLGLGGRFAVAFSFMVRDASELTGPSAPALGSGVARPRSNTVGGMAR